MARKVVFALDDVGEVGGTNYVAAALAKAFLKQGFEVEYVSLLTPKPLDIEVPIFEVNRFSWWTAENPLAAEYPGFLGLRLAVKKLLVHPWSWWRNWRLRRHFRGYDNDTIVIFFTVFIFQVWHKAQAGHRVSPGLTVLQFHSSPAGIEAILPARELESAVDAVDSVLALSQDDAATFSSRFSRTVGFIRNPCLLVSPESSFRDLSDFDNSIVCVTRFDQVKRIEIIVRSFKEACSRLSDPWTLTIWGTGAEYAHIEECVRDLGLQDSVFLPGLTDNPAKAYSRAAFTVLTSKFEGLPISLLEAAACGVPSVCVDASSAVAEIGSSCGWLIPNSADEDVVVTALTEVMAGVMQNKDQIALKSADALRYSEQYSVDSVVRDWIEFFDRELERKRKRNGTP